MLFRIQEKYLIISSGAAKDFAERHGVPKWFEDAKALVDCEDVTAVYVASTPAAHYEHAKLAAEVTPHRAPPHPTHRHV